MEALLIAELPTGPEWHYEPKWDGFRCVIFRDGDTIDLMSKAGKPLARYFPDLVETIRSIKPHLSPSTTSMTTVKQWFRSVGGGLDGVIAKRLDLPYQTGTRHGMRKMKAMRTADCVVGGFRYASKGKVIGSLLLGLYGDGGLLHHVGFTSNIPTAEKPAVTERLEALIEEPGFTGRAPGGPSRWSTERTSKWQPLTTSLVVEVRYDHFSGGRFRHGTSFLRWRPDKSPRQCTIAQVEQEGRSALTLL